jgi:hypothetical protein
MKGTKTPSRAEAVRSRRRTHAEKRLSESTSLATRPFTPIVSRTGPMPAIPQKMTRADARRRAQAEISMAGIEVQMPAIHLHGASIKWRMFSFALAALLGAAIYAAATASEFRVAAAQVSGNERIASDEIDGALGVRGEPIFMLVPADLEKRLRLNYPELASARVALDLPNQVDVSVVERKPSILWQQDEGYTWIDDEGVAFRPRGTAAGLINVKALASPPHGAALGTDPLAPTPFLSADLVAALKTLAPNAPPGEPMLFDPRYGIGWMDGRGWQVFFGSDAANMPLRLEVYKSLVSMLDANGITPIFVNMQYPSAPYYRMTE